MRLIRIEIENFKGVGSRQSMYLAPVTLLFGPNSAGKSTILRDRECRLLPHDRSRWCDQAAEKIDI